MKTIFFTILFFTYSFTSFSQIPGYMGKRFGVGYSNDFFLSGLNPTANNSEENAVGLNTLHSVNLEYGIKNRTNFCFSVQLGKTGIGRKDYTYYYPDTYGGYSSGSIIYQANDKKPIQIKETNFSFGLKFFGRGYIAPVGKYKKVEILLLTSKAVYDKNSFYYSSVAPSNKSTTSYGKGEYNYKSFAIAYTIGRQRVIGKFITLDTGIRFGIVANPIFNILFSDFLDITSNTNYNSSVSMEEQLKPDVQQRLLGQQLVNFHIGIGFLAF